jgi:hypothetical protein
MTRTTCQDGADQLKSEASQPELIDPVLVLGCAARQRVRGEMRHIAPEIDLARLHDVSRRGTEGAG